MRVSAKPIGKYPCILRPFYWNQKRKYGDVLQPWLLWGRVPKLFMAVMLLFGVLDRRGSPLSPTLRSLITVRVSQINWCRFCVDINSAVLAQRSGSMNKVEKLAEWKTSDVFGEKEKAALEYTEAMTYTDRNVTDEMVEKLRAFFDDDAIVELTGLVAFQNLSSKFNNALDVPSQGFCAFPTDPSETRSA